MNTSFDFEIERLIEEIKEREAEKVGLQFPEGLKRHAGKVANKLEKRSKAQIYVSGKPCYGACDLDLDLMKKTDLFIHFGHSPIKNSEKVIYVEAKSNAPVEEVIKKGSDKLDPQKEVCLTSTAQHIHKLEEAKSILKKEDFKIKTIEGDERLDKEAQVLGCNYTSVSESPQVLFLGDGNFHPIGLALDNPDKLLLVADPLKKEVREINPDDFLKKRYAQIEKARNAESWGILVSNKVGQKRETIADNMIEKHEGTFLISLDEITPEKLSSFYADAFVNTACPRISTDDFNRFDRPVLTPIEFEIAIGEKSLEEWEFDTIHGTW